MDVYAGVIGLLLN